jgi:peptidoglycan/xylan/chitin deacetylase (PgdA/CDA1 family)
MRGGWTILTYHRILEVPHEYPLRSLVTPLPWFQEQVRWLARHCRVLPVCQALAGLEQPSADDRPLVSLTFDDGYVDGYTLAAPAMEELGLRGTFFITTGPSSGGKPLWFDTAARWFRRASPETVRAALQGVDSSPRPRAVSQQEWMTALKMLPPIPRQRLLESLPGMEQCAATDQDRHMRPEELRRLCHQGHEVASHSLTHPLLPQLDDQALEHELNESGRLLEEWIGQPPQGFCYPNGDHDQRTADAVRAAGYSYACTTRPARNTPQADRFRLSRVDVGPVGLGGPGGAHDALAFRARISLLREAWI